MEPGEKLDAHEFGRALLEANDLDPVYVMLHEARLGPAELAHWLVAYWCFYHVGTASWVADGRESPHFYDRLLVAAASKDYPRSPERRHFRGGAAVRAARWIVKKSVGDMFAGFDAAAARGETLTAAEVMDTVSSWPMFGPWIAFKAADMLERLGVVAVDFSGQDRLFTSPAAGAARMWQWRCPGLDPDREPGGVTRWALDYLTNGPLKGTPAPPRYERPINEQEAETILCKWKSYLDGRYHVGEDVAACRRGLLRFARCRLSQRLLAGGKRGRLW